MIVVSPEKSRNYKVNEGPLKTSEIQFSAFYMSKLKSDCRIGLTNRWIFPLPLLMRLSIWMGSFLALRLALDPSFQSE